MKGIVLLCVASLITTSYGSSNSAGGGAFSYEDSDGRRYAGTYGLRDGQVVDAKGNFPPNFSPATFQDLDNFFPQYFSNFQNLLAEAFETSIASQKLALETAMKAFDLTSNQAGQKSKIGSQFQPFNDFADFPNMGGFSNGFAGFPSSEFFGRGGDNSAFAGARLGPDFSHQIAEISPGNPNYNTFPGFSYNPSFVLDPWDSSTMAGLWAYPGFQNPNFGLSGNSAYAGANIGPDYLQQIAAISPANPNNPNVNKFSEISNSPGKMKSVSTSSYSSSSSINGRTANSRSAETIINNDGKITKYRVTS